MVSFSPSVAVAVVTAVVFSATLNVASLVITGASLTAFTVKVAVFTLVESPSLIPSAARSTACHVKLSVPL